MANALRRLLKPVAAGADIVHRPPPGITVLAYHRVGAGTDSAVDLPRDLFARQLTELAQQHRVLPLDDAIAALTGQATPPETSAVVITFDDGTADFVDNAVPLLVEHGLPATLYLATRCVEEGRAFWGDDPPLGWEGLREALSTGVVTIGSHTHSHVLLDRLAGDEIAMELDRSIELIADNLGVRAHHFAYPKALDPTPRAADEVAQRFVSAAVAGTTINPYGSTDPQRLRRSPVQRGDGMRWWRHKVRGGMALEDRLRRLVNRRRYAAIEQ